MNKHRKEIQECIRLAKDSVSGIPELSVSFKDIAFKVALEHLLTKTKDGTHASKAPTEEVSQQSECPVGHAKTFASFHRSLGVKSHADKVLAVAYFLYQIKKIRSISLEDIKQEYKGALLPLSKNMSSEVRFNLKRGYLMPIQEGKERKLSITSDGIEHLLSKKGEEHE